MKKVFVIFLTLMVLTAMALAADTLKFEANFNKTDSKKNYWEPFGGEWEIDGEYMVNYDLGSDNTNIWLELDQYGEGVWIYEYKITYDVKGGQWAPAAGLHFMASDAEAPQRGSSYLMFQDLTEIKLYRCEAGGITRVAFTPGFQAIVGETSIIRVEYNTKTGAFTIFHNGVKVIEYVDDDPIVDGQYISLRTNQTQASYDYVKVWYRK